MCFVCIGRKAQCHLGSHCMHVRSILPPPDFLNDSFFVGNLPEFLEVDVSFLFSLWQVDDLRWVDYFGRNTMKRSSIVSMKIRLYDTVDYSKIPIFTRMHSFSCPESSPFLLQLNISGLKRFFVYKMLLGNSDGYLQLPRPGRSLEIPLHTVGTSQLPFSNCFHFWANTFRSQDLSFNFSHSSSMWLLFKG